MRALFEADAVRPGSQVQQLDVRTKILISLLASVTVIFLKSPFSLLFFTTVTGLYVLELGRVRVVGVCYLAICLMWVVSIGFMHLMHRISPVIPVTDPVNMLVPFLRTMIMINTVLALALSSRVQMLLSSLKSLRLPIWLYIPAVVMIRFVPTFIKDVQQIHETMRIRGYRLHPWFLVRHPLVSVRLLVAPILFRALRSADDLGVAAELKGVRPGCTMVNCKPQRFGRRDALAAVITGVVFIVGIYIHNTFGADTTGFFS